MSKMVFIVPCSIQRFTKMLGGHGTSNPSKSVSALDIQG